MKNILVIEPSGKLYGSEMVLLDIITNTDKKKYKFTVALPSHSKFAELLDKHKIASVPLVNISSRFQKTISYIRLYLFIKRQKPDLIFVNQAGIQRIISYIAHLENIPIVSEVSTLEDGLLINTFNSKLHDPVKAYICNSKFIASKVKVPEQKKSILYYGYEWKKLSPTVRDNINPFKVALLGRISVSKGNFLLVEALKLLRDRRPDIDIQVYFIGSAPTADVEKEIRDLIAKYSLEDRFVFRGFQTDVNKELDDMNLMAIPSIQEPFGRIFCETAEAKLPCVVADTGGLGELSKKFDLGVRFSGTDASSLCDQLIYCHDNFQEVKRSFEENAHAFLRKLDKASYIEAIEEILDSALQGNDVSISWFGNENL